MGLLKGFLNLIPGKSHRESIESKYNNSVAEEGIEDPVQATADFIIDRIKDPSTNSQKVLADTIDSDTPDAVFDRVVNQIVHEEPTIANATIALGLAESEKNVPDEKIIEMLDGIKFGDPKARIVLIENIDDQTAREEQILVSLRKFYNSDFSKSRDSEVVERIETIYSSFDFDNSEIDKIAQKIVAKQMAVMYYRSKGGVMLQKYKSLPPTTIEKMMEADMPKLVEKEFNKLYPKEIGKCDPTIIRQAILKVLASDIAKVYEDTKLFVIPSLESIKKLSEQDAEFFINEILSKSKIEEDEVDVTKNDLKSQIRGQYDAEQHARLELDSILNGLPMSKRLELLKFFYLVAARRTNLNEIIKVILDNPQDSIDVLEKEGTTGALQSIMNVPATNREALLKAVKTAVDNKYQEYLETQGTQDTKRNKKDDANPGEGSGVAGSPGENPGGDQGENLGGGAERIKIQNEKEEGPVF